MAVLDQSYHEVRRDELRQSYMQAEETDGEPVATGGVRHLVLISSNLDATIRFYTEVLRMRLTRLVPNREPHVGRECRPVGAERAGVLLVLERVLDRLQGV